MRILFASAFLLFLFAAGSIAASVINTPKPPSVNFTTAGPECGEACMVVPPDYPMQDFEPTWVPVDGDAEGQVGEGA